MTMARKPTPSIPIPTDEFGRELVSRDDLYNAVDRMTVPNTSPSTITYSDIADSLGTTIEGLSVEDLIKDLTDPDGLVPVTVLVSHDNLYAGSRVRLPPSERLVSLIIAGWFEA
jgi:hypothetical protein